MRNGRTMAAAVIFAPRQAGTEKSGGKPPHSEKD
jgi:hypothetical protein